MEVEVKVKVTVKVRVKVRIKAKLSLCSQWRYKKEWHIIPLILNLGTRGKWVISLTPWPF